MGFLDRLLGREPRETYGTNPYDGASSSTGQTYGASAGANPSPVPAYGTPPGPARTPDQIAIDRYRYLLRTAPPDAVEQAHAEAFAALTPQQRQQVLTELGADLPVTERAKSDSPQDLARMATRAEMRRPGTLEQAFAGRGAGLGSMFATSMLGTIAGVVIGSTVANTLFGPAFADPNTPVAEDSAAQADGGSGDASAGDGSGTNGGDGSNSGDAAGDSSASGGDGSDSGSGPGADSGIGDGGAGVDPGAGDAGGFGAWDGGGSVDASGDFGGFDFGGFEF